MHFTNHEILQRLRVCAPFSDATSCESAACTACLAGHIAALTVLARHADRRDEPLDQRGQRCVGHDVVAGHFAGRAARGHLRQVDTQVARDVVAGDEDAYAGLASQVPIGRSARLSRR